MSKIAIENMSFYYETVYHPIFEKVSLTLDSEWKLGLIGRNGKGKTTLFRLLDGSLEAKEGRIETTVQFSVFPYQYTGNYTLTMDVIKECIGGLKTMEDRLEHADASDEYMGILQKYIDMDGYEMEGKIRKELTILGLDSNLLEQSFYSLSGGERTCMMIIALFLRKDSFVLLDEPTNHLDISKRAILKEYLKKQKGFILISHDFDFLDAVVNHILAINKVDINLEKGNYSTWKNNVLLKEEFEKATQEKLEREIKSLEKRAVINRDWASIGNTQKYAFRAKSARTNGAQKYMRQAKNAEERVRKDIEAKKELLLNVEERRSLNIYQELLEELTLLEVSNLSFSYRDDRKLFEDISFSILPGDRLWIRGENGAGKSTLLKLLAGELENNSLEENIIFADGVTFSYATQDPKWSKGFLQDYLGDDMERQIRFREICEQFDLPEDIYQRSLATLSSGELKKIDIARAISQKNDILFLDEPLNYMDYMFKEQLETTLLEQNVTVIFVEHDEEFGKKVATKEIKLVGQLNKGNFFEESHKFMI